MQISQLREGDLLLMSGIRAASYSIRIGTNSTYSHVAIVLRMNGQLAAAQASPNPMYVPDVFGNEAFGGVYATSIEKELKTGMYEKVDVWRTPLLSCIGSSARHKLAQLYGERYEESGTALSCTACGCLSLDTPSMSCGEFVTTLMEHASLLPPKWNVHIVVPADFMGYPEAKLVGSLHIPRISRSVFWNGAFAPPMDPVSLTRTRSLLKAEANASPETCLKTLPDERRSRVMLLAPSILALAWGVGRAFWPVGRISAPIRLVLVLSYCAVTVHAPLPLGMVAALMLGTLARQWIAFLQSASACWVAWSCDFAVLSLALYIAMRSGPRPRGTLWASATAAAVASYFALAIFAPHVPAWLPLLTIACLAAAWQSIDLRRAHIRVRTSFPAVVFTVAMFGGVLAGLLYISLGSAAPLRTMNDAFAWADSQHMQSSAYTLFEGSALPTGETHEAAYIRLIDRIVERGKNESVSLKLQQFADAPDASREAMNRVCTHAAQSNVTCVISAFQCAEDEFNAYQQLSSTLPASRRQYLGLCLEADVGHWATQARRLAYVVNSGGTVRWVKGGWYRGNTVSGEQWTRVTERYVAAAMSLLELEGPHIVATHDLLTYDTIHDLIPDKKQEWAVFFYAWSRLRKYPGDSYKVSLFFGEGGGGFQAQSLANNLLRVLDQRTYGLTLSHGRIMEEKRLINL